MAVFTDFSSTCGRSLCRCFYWRFTLQAGRPSCSTSGVWIHGRQVHGLRTRASNFQLSGNRARVQYRSMTSQSTCAGAPAWRPRQTCGKNSEFNSGAAKNKGSRCKSTWLLNFLASWLGEHLECSPCGELAVSCMSSLGVEGGRCRRCCCRACWKSRIIPFGPRKSFVYAGFGGVFSLRDWASNSRKRSRTAGSLEARAARSAISLSRLSC